MNYEVNKIVEELYTCLPNDRNRFNNIMDNLKQQFLTAGNKPMNFNKGINSQLINENSIEANNINKLNFKTNSLNNVNNLINNTESISSLNPLKGLNNLQPITLPTLNVKNKKNDALINDDLGEVININNINKEYQIGTYNENNKYENNIKNDIHANFKYYYPEEFNNQMNDNNKYQNY